MFPSFPQGGVGPNNTQYGSGNPDSGGAHFYDGTGTAAGEGGGVEGGTEEDYAYGFDPTLVALQKDFEQFASESELPQPPQQHHQQQQQRGGSTPRQMAVAGKQPPAFMGGSGTTTINGGSGTGQIKMGNGDANMETWAATGSSAAGTATTRSGLELNAMAMSFEAATTTTTTRGLEMHGGSGNNGGNRNRTNNMRHQQQQFQPPRNIITPNGGISPPLSSPISNANTSSKPAPVATTPTPTSSSSSSLQRMIERNSFAEAATFILECKGNDEAAALDFLRGVCLVMVGGNNGDLSDEWGPDGIPRHDGAVRGGPPYITPEDQAAAQANLVINQQQSLLLQAQRLGIIPRPPRIMPITHFGDEIDQRVSTLVILVPGRSHIVGHLIGKGGTEVGRIEREMAVTIKIESASKMSAALMERSVCIIGSVAATTAAQQYVSHKVHEKLLSEGVQAEVLKMIVPNEIVRHLIGKSGSNINRLQNESGARIQVEPESTMTPGAMGRTIVLQGAERCRTFAQYLILRQIAEDRNVHAEWAGRTPQLAGGTTMMPQQQPLQSREVGSGGYNNVPPTSPSTASFMASIAGLGGQVGDGGGVTSLSSITTFKQFVPSSHLGNEYDATSLHQQPSSVVMDGNNHNHGVPSPSHTITFNLTESAVTLLIGHGGTIVSEIQNQTGTKIFISKFLPRNDPSGGEEGMRKITIFGPSEAIEYAQLLIFQHLSSVGNGGGGGDGDWKSS